MESAVFVNHFLIYAGKIDEVIAELGVLAWKNQHLKGIGFPETVGRGKFHGADLDDLSIVAGLTPLAFPESRPTGPLAIENDQRVFPEHNPQTPLPAATRTSAASEESSASAMTSRGSASVIT